MDTPDPFDELLGDNPTLGDLLAQLPARRLLAQLPARRGGRRLPLCFRAELGPHETTTITVETSVDFRGDRLCVPTVRRGRVEALLAWTWHLIHYVPRTIFYRLAGYDPLSWRLGPKPPPVSIDAITIDRVPQLSTTSIPAEVFQSGEISPRLGLDTAPAGSKVSLTVTNRSAKPFTFRATLIGILPETR